MAFTALFASTTLLLLAVIFWLTYYFKGLRTALIATGISLVVIVLLFIVMIYVIVSVMP